jgi:hypothetical protein
METDYSPFIMRAFAVVAALVGAIVGLFMLIGITSRLIGGASRK